MSYANHTAIEARPLRSSGGLASAVAARGGTARSFPASYPPDASLSIVGTFSNFHAHRRFCSEGESADYVYRMAEGVAEGYRITADGRRQIIEFYSPGDLFGFELGSNYTIFVDSITEGRVQSIKKSTIAELIATNAVATSELWTCLSEGMHRSQKHILRLGQTAEERLAGFILEMCDRVAGADEIHLPMTRQDIADYLDLTIETVSRTMTHLQKIGVIQLSGSRNVGIDRKKLSRLVPR